MTYTPRSASNSSGPGGQTALTRAIVSALLLALPPLAVAISWLVEHDTLPSQLPAHWSGFDTPDRLESTVTSFWLAFGVSGGLALIGIVAIVWSQVSPRARSASWLTLLTISPITATFALTWFGSIWATRAAGGDPSSAVLGWGILLIIPTLAYGFLPVIVLKRPGGDRDGDDTDERIDLAPDETAVWGTTTTFAVFGWGAVICLALGGFIFWRVASAAGENRLGGSAAPYLALLPLVLSAVLLIALVRLRITADTRGLTVRSVFLGIRLRHIPLDRIASVDAQTLEPLAWGGWGWRFFGDGSAFIAGRGPGLAVTLTNGRRFGVSTPDAETGAALLATLRDRAHQH